jgi:hypothetical protein
MAVTSTRQHPRAEGFLNRLVLAGTVVAIKPYYSVNESKGKLVLNGGWLLGLNQGSKVGFFPAETRDYLNNKPTATGVINISEPGKSIVLADKPFSALKGSWVYMLEQSPGELYVNIRLDIRDTALHRKVTDEIKKRNIFGFDEEPDCYIYQDILGDSIFVGDRQNSAIYRFPAKMQGVEYKIIYLLESLAQGTYIRKLDFSDDSDFRFNIEIVLVDTTFDGKVAKSLQPLRKDSFGKFVLTEGTPFIIKVNNQGKKAGFFNIIDIDPLNKVNVIAPYFDSKEIAEDFYLNPEQEFILPRGNHYFKVNPPYGMETLKLFVTDQKIDMRQVFKSFRGKREIESPIERLISNIFHPEDTATRGNNTIPSDSLGVFTLNMEILPKKVMNKP